MIQSFTSFALPITTAQIQGATEAGIPACFRHSQLEGRFVGRCCFVTFPGGAECTELVEHYVPDSVIRVHNYVDQDPWVDLFSIGLPLPQLTTGNSPKQDVGRSELLFKHTAANGNPLTSLFPTIMRPRMPPRTQLCPSATRSFFFHYDSSMDTASWNTNAFRELAALPVELGILGVDSWGHAFNLDGWVNNTHPGKGAAVIAKRASLIITGSIFDLPNFFRVVNRIPKVCGGLGCHTFPGRPNTASPAMEQSLSPVPSPACGAIGPAILPGGSQSFKLNIQGIANPQQTQAYNQWHCYKCCEPPRGGFIIAGPAIIPVNPLGCGVGL